MNKSMTTDQLDEFLKEIYANRCMTQDEYEELSKQYGRRSDKKHPYEYPQYVNIVEKMEENINDHAILWCVENCKGDWCFGRSFLGFGACVFGFENDEDATAFKLRWI